MKFTQAQAETLFAERFKPLADRKEALRHRLQLFYDYVVQAPVPFMGCLAFPGTYPKHERRLLAKTKELAPSTFPPVYLMRFMLASGLEVAFRARAAKPQAALACASAWFASARPPPLPGMGPVVDAAAKDAIKPTFDLQAHMDELSEQAEKTAEDKAKLKRWKMTSAHIQKVRLDFLDRGDFSLDSALASLTELSQNQNTWYWNVITTEWHDAVVSIRKKLQSDTYPLSSLTTETGVQSDHPGLPLHFFSKHGKWPEHIDAFAPVSDQRLASQYAIESWLRRLPTEVPSS